MRLFIICMLIINYAQGANTITPVSNLVPTTTLNAIKESSLLSPAAIAKSTTTLPNLNSIDDSADDLQKKRRILENEKLNAEIKRARNPDTASAMGISAASSETAQTTVTGVAIDEEGKKSAWLQFADGGVLTVNLGSKVGKYQVTDITMTGVKLSYWTGKKKVKQNNVFLKRAYYTTEKPKTQMINNTSPFYNPSPIITGANTSNQSEFVPPIVSTK